MRNLYLNAIVLLGLSMTKFSAVAQHIVQLSFYSPLISTFDMVYANDHLFISQDGLLTFDVSQPTKQPKLLSKTPYPGSIANTIAVQGSYIFMAQGANGIFAVYNISDPKKPALTGSISIPSTSFTPGDLAPFHNYVYMASFDSIYVINISDKTAPKLTNVVHVRNPGFAGADALAIDGNALFARTPFSTEIYAVTNPKKPVFVGNIPNSHTYSRGLSIDSVNHRLFTPWLTTLQEYMGFDVYDISNPLSPKFLFADSIPFGGGEFGVSAYSYTNHVLYVTTGGSINAFDVSDSTHGFVTEFNGEDVANSSVSVQVKDSIFYNAKRGGFEVLKYTSSTEPFCPASMYLRSRVENGQAFLRWDKIDGAEGYLVRYKTADAETWSDDRFTSTNRDTLRNLSPDTKYLWNVRTVCSTSPLSRSTWARRDDFFTTEQSMDDLISFGPNPVRDIFNINIKSSQVSQLVVTDLAGNTVLQTRPLKRNNDFNFSKFRTGTYLLQVLNNRMEIIESVKVFKE